LAPGKNIRLLRQKRLQSNRGVKEDPRESDVREIKGEGNFRKEVIIVKSHKGAYIVRTKVPMVFGFRRSADLVKSC
jgi:hypothetical protein